MEIDSKEFSSIMRRLAKDTIMALTPEQRRERARKAGLASAAKRLARKQGKAPEPKAPQGPINAAAAALGSLGGKGRAAKVKPERLSEIGRDAANVRWGKPDRCPCGLMTLKRAAQRRHQCSKKDAEK